MAHVSHPRERRLLPPPATLQQLSRHVSVVGSTRVASGLIAAQRATHSARIHGVLILPARGAREENDRCHKGKQHRITTELTTTHTQVSLTLFDSKSVLPAYNVASIL